MASGPVRMDIENVGRVSVRRFSFFMKGIAENNLWSEIESLLEEMGCTEVVISSEPMAAVQELLKRKVTSGEHLSPRGLRAAASDCGGGGGGGGGDDDDAGDDDDDDDEEE
jgi:hypothetical protein